MRDEAEKRIGHLYPKVRVTKEIAAGRDDLMGLIGDELTVIAWLWARTVKCPNPACGAQMPLVRSFALSTRKARKRGSSPSLIIAPKSVRFPSQNREGEASRTPKTGRDREVQVSSLSDRPVGPHVRRRGQAGRMGAQLMAVVAEGTGAASTYANPRTEDQICGGRGLTRCRNAHCRKKP